MWLTAFGSFEVDFYKITQITIYSNARHISGGFCVDNCFGVFRNCNKMQFPYQCILTVGSVLVTATGQRLETFDIATGKSISSWEALAKKEEEKPVSKAPVAEDHEEVEAALEKTEEVAGSPPAKRRRLSNDGAEQVAEKKEKKEHKNQEPKPKPGTNRAPALGPYFIALTASENGDYVVAVTGEDKTVRVFEHRKGELELLSER
jgi:tRNA (guanine-N(7)-)-methyltransferase subunit TRM82